MLCRVLAGSACVSSLRLASGLSFLPLRLSGSACRTLTTAQRRRVFIFFGVLACALRFLTSLTLSPLPSSGFVSSAFFSLLPSCPCVSSLHASSSLVSLKSSPRPISTAKLHALPRFHRRPIYPVVFRGPYLFPVGPLFLRGASRLDAFSVYPGRTSLPCYAVGTTTVAPVVRPLRSSRTRSSSSHDSYAHDG